MSSTNTPSAASASTSDDQSQDVNYLFCKKFTQYVNLITENRLDENGKFKAAQELSEHLEFIVQNPYYNQFLKHLLNEFLAFIENGESIYQENYKAQIRKLVLEIIHRLPRNGDLGPYAHRIQSIMFKLVERENEDCALVCMRTIHELHKMPKPNNLHQESDMLYEIRKFLKFVIASFQNLPDTMRRALINENPSSQPGAREPKSIPRATHSLKVLADLPLHVVVFHQSLQENIEEDVCKLLSNMINSTLTLHPDVNIKNSENFVQDAFVDFITVQIKTVSFLAYMIKQRPYHEIIENNSVNFIKGLISCFRFCPSEAPHLRREIMVAWRHLVSGNQCAETISFKHQMVNFMDELLDEKVLIGTGWTNKESSRCLAYNTLAELIHQVREKLSLKQLAGIVYLFSKNVHDNDLAPAMQIMSCKILINIVDYINKKSEKEAVYTGRDLLMKMLEVFIQKFESVAKHQLPELFARCAKQVGTEIPTCFPTKAEALNNAAIAQASKKGQGTLAGAIQECRQLVGLLVRGVKAITFVINAYKHPQQNHQKIQPGETYMFIRLLKYGLQCLNIYRIQVGPPPNRITYVRSSNNNQIRSKEEKDILDYFAAMFTWNVPTFKEVFETQIDYLIESIHNNQSLILIPHYFLTVRDPNRDAIFSSLFAYQLAKYLVDKLEIMGCSEAGCGDRPVLYSRLFKLLFTSVQIHGQDVDTEGILKPHLQRIVNQSMTLSQTAKEPINYFGLLRLLFRAIGSASGTYDEMYNEFLPLLPSLLQSLNRLQSGLHKPQMNNIFIELCLTVPVRLSNLLPYLPALMDPLVSALNGSNPLIAQGLRTLELCIDNLQPSFFYDKIEPVRAELIHALWKTLQTYNESDNNAKSAYRVLGKFGARNRKTLQDPPRLEYVNPEVTQASVVIWFPGSTTPVKIPVQKILEHALSILRCGNRDIFYMQHSLHVMQCYIVSMINLSDTTIQIQKLLVLISRKQATPLQVNKNNLICTDEASRNAFKTALLGIFVATSTKQLRAEATQFMMSIVRHFSLLTIVQQSGVFTAKKKINSSLDVHILIDVIAECLGSEENELANIGEKAIRLVTETCKYILGDRAFQIPFFDVLVEKLCGLCYDRAWYTKAGGITAIEWLMNNAPLLWIIKNQQLFINATLYVMMDLYEEVSYGTMTRTEELYLHIIRHCNTPSTQPNIVAAQEKVFLGVVHHLIKELMSAYSIVRKQARKALLILSEVTHKSVDVILESLPKDLVPDTILPKKQPLFSLPQNRQLACMEAVVFCSTLEKRLITLDVMNFEWHKKFLDDTIAICSLPKSELLSKYYCYKKHSDFTKLKKNSLKVLASCRYIVQYEAEIFKVMYQIMNDTDKELQEAAKDAIHSFNTAKHIDVDIVHNEIRPLLQKLTDPKTLNIHLIKVLTYLMELFPTMFNEKLCDQLLKTLKKWMESSIYNLNPHQPRTHSFKEEVLLCQAIINTFHLIPPPKNFFGNLISCIVRAEKCLSVEIGSPFQEGLFKFVLKHPEEAVDIFLKELHEPSMNRMFYNFLKQKNGGSLRNFLCKMPMSILTAASIPPQSHDNDYSHVNDINMRLQELLFQGIKIIGLLSKHNPDFLVKNREVINHLKNIWNQPSFQAKFRSPDKHHVPIHQWKEPKLLVKCLLLYLKHCPDDIELLFQTLHIFDAIYIPDMKFLTDHLQNNVVQGFTIEQRRACFFKFVEIYPLTSSRGIKWTSELKGKILQHIIVPMFQHSFSKGDVEALIEGKHPPNRQPKTEDNIINVFMDKDNKIIIEEKEIDVIRIHLLKLAAEFVKHAADYIHPTSPNRDRKQDKEGDKLRNLMKYAWPCMLPKLSHDPTTKYYGHLVLALIISKFPIHKKIVIQVFHSLLKAYNADCRSVVFSALQVITPAMPSRMDDGKAMLYHWTKKIIVEEGHTVSQLVHILNLIVKQYRVYYHWRQYLIQHMLTAMQKFSFNQNLTIDHQRLASELAEVVLKWEIQRVHEEAGISLTDKQIEGIISGATGLLLNQTEIPVEPYKTPTQVSLSPCPLRPPSPEPLAPFEPRYGEGVFNFLLRLAYSAYTRDNNTNIQHSEALSKRCIQLVKLGMKPELAIFKNSSPKIYNWADSQLQRIKTPPQNAPGNPAYFLQGICTILQLVEFLLDYVQDESIVMHNIFLMSRGLYACIIHSNIQIIKTVHSLLAKMFIKFPIEQKREKLEVLYNNINEIILSGLERYDKDPLNASEVLFSPLTILKYACATSPKYLDRFLKEYMKCFQKLQKEHCSVARDPNQRQLPRDRQYPNLSTSDLIMVCIDLIKDQLDLLINVSDIRKAFFGILTLLIEKSPDPKLLKNLTEVVGQWVKTSSGATMRERALLLTKMNTNYERRYPHDKELMSTFLDVILFVYTDETLQAELGQKLESAFMTGLRFSEPDMRCKFTEVLRLNVASDMPGRLLALISPHNFNWKLIGPHFWIKQFIEMLISVNDSSKPITPPNPEVMLPSLHVSAYTDSTTTPTPTPATAPNSSGEPAVSATAAATGDNATVPTTTTTTTATTATPAVPPTSTPPGTTEVKEESNINPPTHNNVQMLAEKHGTFLESLKNNKSSEFITSICQLFHDNTSVAYHAWINIFPELWNVLSKEVQMKLSRDLPSFLCSVMHQEQGEIQPSSVGCILHSLIKVPIPIRACYLKYLGGAHNAWHQMALKLEELGTSGETFASFQLHQKQVLGEYPVIKDDTQDNVAYEAIDCLTALYSQLNEHDMWTGLWLRRCKYPETIKALSYQNLGFFELAQNVYEGAMKNATLTYKNSTATTAQQTEFKLWKDQWIECTKQCSQWDILNEFSRIKGSQHPSLLMESAWRIPDWTTMKDVLNQADKIIPNDMSHVVSLYRGYLALQQDEDPGQEGPVEKFWIQAINNALKRWRKLPPIVSNVHVPLLQFAQQVAELHEAQTIHKNLLPNKVNQHASKSDIKGTLKAWRNRKPVISDDITHWNDVFSWRQHNHQKIIDVYTTLENQVGMQDNSEHNITMLQNAHQQNVIVGQQHAAATIVTYASLARKHGLSSSAQEWLARVHTIPHVNVSDCHKKLKEQIKTHLLPPANQQDVIASLDIIEGINMRVMTKPEHRADILSLKAYVLSLLGKSEDAMRTFSQAIQVNDQSTGAWGLWGQYCDELFKIEKNMYHAESAIACYLQACNKQKDDAKVRKYISRILWLLVYDNAEETLSKILEKFHTCVALERWLEWIPQLLAGLGSKEARVFHLILQNIGRNHPQALYFPIRNVYLSVRTEYQDIMGRHKQLLENNPNKSEIPEQPPELTRLRPRMAWCTKLLNILRDIHPTLLSALESIIDTLCYMKDPWYDEVLHKLYTAISMCEEEAFEIDHRQDVLNVKISPHIYKYIHGIMNYLNNAVSGTTRAGATRDLSKQPSIKHKFEADFDFSNNQGRKLHKVLKNLKNWVKMLDKSQSSNNKVYLEERCSFFSRFCASTADVYLIGEYLNPKAHYVKIARFLPKIETIRKHSISARRLFIRGSNGRVYPYLMVHTSSNVRKARSEERFLQLIRMLNNTLTQRKESCKRNLQWRVPKVVAVSPGSRLIEDDVSNISILEIYKWYCKNRTPEMDVDAPIAYYYEQLGHMQNDGSVLNRVALGNIYHYIQKNILPPTVLQEWAKKTYPDPVMYWTFRHQITRHTALDCLVQFALFLSSLKPEFIYVTRQNGSLSTIHYQLPVNRDTGEFQHEQPIPFRLTPNMMALMGPTGVSGLMVFCMIAAARCLTDPKLGVDGILHVIIKDEVQSTIKEVSEKRISSMISDIPAAVNSILSRLQTAASFEKAENKLPSLISLTTTPENLCRLDPAWYPWL